MKVGRIPSDEDINWVHTRIEYCIQNYMNKNETMHILHVHLNIDPAFTRTVWEKLEMDNPEFFRAYYASLSVKDQIEEFNKLLWKQVELMYHYQGIVIEVNDGPYSDISPNSTQQISTLSSAAAAKYVQR